MLNKMYIVMWNSDSDILSENLRWTSYGTNEKAKFFLSEIEAINKVLEISPSWISSKNITVKYMHPLNSGVNNVYSIMENR